MPYNISNVGDTIQYIKRDGDGPHNWTSGWYYGATPGNYNWQTADEFDDRNNNKIYDFGETGSDIKQKRNARTVARLDLQAAKMRLLLVISHLLVVRVPPMKLVM